MSKLDHAQRIQEYGFCMFSVIVIYYSRDIVTSMPRKSMQIFKTCSLKKTLEMRNTKLSAKNISKNGRSQILQIYKAMKCYWELDPGVPSLMLNLHRKLSATLHGCLIYSLFTDPAPHPGSGLFSRVWIVLALIHLKPLQYFFFLFFGPSGIFPIILSL